MPRCLSLTLIGLAVSVLALPGCEEAPVGVPHTHNPAAEVTLCGLCGEVKESEKCCKEGIALCPNCGLHKGSILCCSTAISGRRDVVLCRKCGEVAFGKKCCKAGPVLCTKCGLHKGSPGCCKIEKVAADATGDEYEHTHAEGEGHS
jgi:hypothetical protein